MRFRALLLIMSLFSFSVIGCGGGDEIPADAPKAPEPGSPEYDAYSSGSRSGPGSGHNASGGAGGHNASK